VRKKCSELEKAFRRAEIFGSIMVPINRTETSATNRAKQCRHNKMTLAESSPEKAGVGGSIPSLATMFSITCKSSIFAWVHYGSKTQLTLTALLAFLAAA